MKKIGFIDHFLDEWHANQFPAWIRGSDERRGLEIALAWAEMDKEGGLTTDQWCEKHRVARAGSLEEIVDKSDCLVILSPDHPERHEELSEPALKSGKPVYIDKTFAPDVAAARRMFALAEDHGTPMFSCSALRFAAELDQIEKSLAPGEARFVNTGGGGRVSTYLVHQAEMAVRLLGTGAHRVMVVGEGETAAVTVQYPDGRQAVMQIMPNLPFRVSAAGADGAAAHHLSVDHSFFQHFIDAVLRFFHDRQPPVSAEDTLQIMVLIEAARQAAEKPGTWVNL